MIIKIIGIIAITTIIVAYFYYESGKKEIEKTNNANVKGWLGVKSDRINTRIDKLRRTIRVQNSNVAVEDLDKFIKAIEIMIAQELTYKGIEKEENNESNLRIYR